VTYAGTKEELDENGEPVTVHDYTVKVVKTATEEGEV